MDCAFCLDLTRDGLMTECLLPECQSCRINRDLGLHEHCVPTCTFSHTSSKPLSSLSYRDILGTFVPLLTQQFQLSIEEKLNVTLENYNRMEHLLRVMEIHYSLFPTLPLSDVKVRQHELSNAKDQVESVARAKESQKKISALTARWSELPENTTFSLSNQLITIYRFLNCFQPYLPVLSELLPLPEGYQQRLSSREIVTEVEKVYRYPLYLNGEVCTITKLGTLTRAVSLESNLTLIVTKFLTGFLNTQGSFLWTLYGQRVYARDLAIPGFPQKSYEVPLTPREVYFFQNGLLLLLGDRVVFVEERKVTWQFEVDPVFTVSVFLNYFVLFTKTFNLLVYDSSGILRSMVTLPLAGLLKTATLEDGRLHFILFSGNCGTYDFLGFLQESFLIETSQSHQNLFVSPHGQIFEVQELLL